MTGNQENGNKGMLVGIVSAVVGTIVLVVSNYIFGFLPQPSKPPVTVIVKSPITLSPTHPSPSAASPSPTRPLPGLTQPSPASPLSGVKPSVTVNQAQYTKTSSTTSQVPHSKTSSLSSSQPDMILLSPYSLTKWYSELGVPEPQSQIIAREKYYGKIVEWTNYADTKSYPYNNNIVCELFMNHVQAEVILPDNKKNQNFVYNLPDHVWLKLRGTISSIDSDVVILENCKILSFSN